MASFTASACRYFKRSFTIGVGHLDLAKVDIERLRVRSARHCNGLSRLLLETYGQDLGEVTHATQRESVLQFAKAQGQAALVHVHPRNRPRGELKNLSKTERENQQRWVDRMHDDEKFDDVIQGDYG